EQESKDAELDMASRLGNKKIENKLEENKAEENKTVDEEKKKAEQESKDAELDKPLDIKSIELVRWDEERTSIQLAVDNINVILNRLKEMKEILK
ncbi:MAG: hypothetical protein ACRDA5_16035, partial [Clostridium sp.]